MRYVLAPPYEYHNVIGSSWLRDGGDEEANANAVMFAAAPDLLEAAEAAEAAINRSVSGVQQYTAPEWGQLLATLQKAIRKAKEEA